MKRFVIAASALAAAACSMEPKYVRPVAPIPEALPVGTTAVPDKALPSITYRDVFHDSRLQTLIASALVNNRHLRVTAANIAEARATVRIQRAQQFPEIDATGTAGYSDRGTAKTSGGAFSGDIGTTAFELDLFGRLSALTHAEQDRLFATDAAARAVRLTLTADIADGWLAYASDKTLLDIAQKTAAVGKRVVALTQLRFDNGVAPRSDVMQAEQILQVAQADVADQRTAIDQDVNALRLLTGGDVDPALLPATLTEVQDTVAALPVGLDSRVLLRRPDVVQAEYTLRAANAEIGAARAALFPQISLTGAFGLASGSLAALFTGGAFANSATASAAYPIFRAGAGRAKVAATKARRDVALASYEHAIQVAFREVADALARRTTIADKVKAITLEEQAAAGAFRLSEMRYRGAVEPFLTTLDAQRSLYVAQRTLALTRLAEAHNRVVVYRTLGGDALIDVLPPEQNTLAR